MGECCNPTTYSGYQSITPQRIQVDTGAVFIDWIFGVDDFDTAVAAGKLLCATQGGLGFTATPTMRSTQVDGVKGKAKGLQNIDMWEITLAVNSVEMSNAVIQKAMVTPEVTIGDLYESVKAKNYICDEDYVGNVTWVGKVQGKDEPIIIQLFDALNNNGYQFTPQDSAESVIPLIFEAHYNAAALDYAPFEVHNPKDEGTVSGNVLDGIQAQGTLTVDTQVSAADTMIIGTKTYTFVNPGDFDADGEISIGSDLATGQAAIIAAINGTDGVNDPNEEATIADFATNNAILTAVEGGTIGNGVVTTSSFTTGTNQFDATTLGTTTPGSGTVVEGATVEIVVGTKTFTTTSDADGNFLLCSIPYSPAAGYTVTATKDAKTGTAVNQVVVGGQDTDTEVITIS